MLWTTVLQLVSVIKRRLHFVLFSSGDAYLVSVDEEEESLSQHRYLW